MQLGEKRRVFGNGYVHPEFEDVARSLHRVVPKLGEGGGAVCVYHRGDCVVDLWAGTRDESGTPWQSDSLALSWSTTKGVLSTLLHILVDRGFADYDDPVARYWPKFSKCGKGGITLRHVLCHEAGLYRIAGMLEHAREMLDWDRMVSALEDQVPVHGPGRACAYHGLTYGWLVGELIRRIGCGGLQEQIQKELVEPLGLDGLYLGLPAHARGRWARVVDPAPGPQCSSEAASARRSEILATAVRAGRCTDGFAEVEAALLPPGFESLDWNSPEVLSAAIPGIGGVFTARSLARLYAALSDWGRLGEVSLLSRRTLERATQIQSDSPGRVIPVSMQWRLGYHRVPVSGGRAPRAFGHFGVGGSGAWADPDRKLAVALVLNSGIGSPFGDMRIVRVSSAALRSADRRCVMA